MGDTTDERVQLEIDEPWSAVSEQLAISLRNERARTKEQRLVIAKQAQTILNLQAALRHCKCRGEK